MADKAPHCYFLNKEAMRQYRILAISLFVLGLALGAIILYLAHLVPGHLPGQAMVYLSAIVLSGFLSLFALCHLNSPVVELGEGYIKVKGGRIELSRVSKVEVLNNMTLALYTESGVTRFLPLVMIKLLSVENPEDLIEKLKEQLPGMNKETLCGVSQAEILKDLHQKRLDMPVTYRNYVFTPEGIRIGGRLVEWERVKRVRYEEGAIYGYTSASFAYRAEDGILYTEKMKPQTSEAYHGCLLYLAHYAAGAGFDKPMADVIKHSPIEAKIDAAVIFMSLSGVIAGIILGGYVTKFNMKGEVVFFSLLAFLLPLLMLVVTLFLCLAQGKGFHIPKALRVAAGALGPLVAAAVLAYVLIITPEARP